MKTKITLLVVINVIIQNAYCAKPKILSNNASLDQIKKDLEKSEKHLLSISRNKTHTGTFVVTKLGLGNIKPQVPINEKKNIITPEVIHQWAESIASKLETTEKHVVRRRDLIDGFVDRRSGGRDGAALAEKAAVAFSDLLRKRVAAAQAIMRKAEQLQSKTNAPRGYTFNYSYKLNQPKRVPTTPMGDANLTQLLTCRDQGYVPVRRSDHFDALVSLDQSSVHVTSEVFDCDPQVLRDIHWSEALDSVYRENYRQDASLGFQYFCDTKGFLRHYPAATWESMFKLPLTEESEDESDTGTYDCRLRPWYVSAGGAPRDILILLDSSGSLNGSSNAVMAEIFTLALLNALTDDDEVNVLRFNNTIKSAIQCFDDMLIPANHINTAAIMATLKFNEYRNLTFIGPVLKYGVKMLQRHREMPGRRPPCQQAMVLITDTLNENLTHVMREMDPDGSIRLFVIWLHDPFGLRDGSRQYSEQLSCTSDGYFAELVTHADATEQVLRLLRVLERPLVMQREERLTVFGDVYAHVEDPRRGEFHWKEKEDDEQKYRYKALRKDKARLMNSSQLYKDYMYQVSLDEFGQYYEGVDVNYRLQISISVPVFENTTSENVSKTLEEEMKRTSTRTYPVNRLLGVAGVDIPLDHLKLILPFYRYDRWGTSIHKGTGHIGAINVGLGGGGSLFIVDHRGNMILHENIKPTLDADILKPGYRTVDFIDLEQAGGDHQPRHYPSKWLKFRNSVVIDHPKGTETLFAKHIFENGMRAATEEREYNWKRVMDHYTVVVAQPRRRRPQAVPMTTKFTQKMAEDAIKTLSESEFAVHPDWLYCRYVHKSFESPENELLAFLRRRRGEPGFAMKKLEHVYSNIKSEAGNLGKTYQCDEELMSRVCADANATALWAERHESGVNCTACDLGSVTAFVATESGLTRWRQYHATVTHAEAPWGGTWARGAGEPWYARAVGAPNALIVHAPVAPIQKKKISYEELPPIGDRALWLTAVRALELEGKGVVGVAGFHFHPLHLKDVLEGITNSPYTDVEELHIGMCDGVEWSCLLIDDAGWVVVAGGDEEEASGDAELPRPHLATLHPAVMAALLGARVFELNWIHDYQAVCFPPAEEKTSSAGPIVNSIIKSLWSAMKAIIRASSEALTIAMLSSYGRLVSSETTAEKEKRRRSIKKNFEREKFDRLFDERVLVNRTKIAACDRSRPLYVLHRDKAAEAFKRAMTPCAWPLVGALVPRTNLALLAVYRGCPQGNVFPPDPMVNQKQKIPTSSSNEKIQALIKMQEQVDKNKQSAAAVLACWRNVVPLPSRAPHLQCFKHEYDQEEGYRQCGPWLPDLVQPEDD